jgi:molybdenum cofactor guanylyltransferase
MGADKALLEIEGETLLERTVRVFRTLFDEVVVVGPNRAITDLDATVVPDEHPGFGPLAGLITGLSSISSDRAFVTGCDMPHLSADAIKYLLTIERSGAEAIVPVISGIVQPLHAVYARRVLPKLRAELAQGGRSLISALRRLHVGWISDESFPEPNSALRSFTSIDTPEEWLHVVAEAGAKKQAL